MNKFNRVSTAKQKNHSLVKTELTFSQKSLDGKKEKEDESKKIVNSIIDITKNNSIIDLSKNNS